MSRKMHRSERAFMRRVQRLGIRISPCMVRLHLLDGRTYLPDFYLPDLNTFVEVSSSSSCYQHNLSKYRALMSQLGVNFWIVTPDFKAFDLKMQRALVSGTCSYPGCTDETENAVYYPRLRQRFCARHLERLEREWKAGAARRRLQRKAEHAKIQRKSNRLLSQFSTRQVLAEIAPSA